MKQLRQMAHRMGLQGVPALLLALMLSVAVVSAGCGAEGRADTADDPNAEAQESEDGSEDGEEKAEEGEAEEEDAKVAIPVSVASIEQGTVSAYLSATANLVAENEVKVLAEAEGRVDRLLVDEGQLRAQGAATGRPGR